MGEFTGHPQNLSQFAALQQSIEELSQDLQDLLQSAQEMLHSMQTLLDASRAAVQGGAVNATHAHALLAPPVSGAGGVTGEQQEQRAAEVREGSMQIFAPPLARRWRVDGGGNTSGV